MVFSSISSPASVIFQIEEHNWNASSVIPSDVSMIAWAAFRAITFCPITNFFWVNLWKSLALIGSTSIISALLKNGLLGLFFEFKNLRGDRFQAVPIHPVDEQNSIDVIHFVLDATT